MIIRKRKPPYDIRYECQLCEICTRGACGYSDDDLEEYPLANRPPDCPRSEDEVRKNLIDFGKASYGVSELIRECTR